MIRALCVIAALLLCPSAALSQTTTLDTARARTELALLMMGFEWNWERLARIEVGRAWGSFDSTLVPPRAKVLGGTSSMLVLETSETPAQAMMLVRDHFESRGIRAVTARRREGFVFGSEVRNPSESPATFCRDSSSIMVRARAAWSGAGTLIHLRHNPPYEGSPCVVSRTVEVQSPRDWWGTIEVPSLRPPAGVSSTGGRPGGSGASSDGDEHVQAHADIRSSMSTAEMMAHYSTQLTEAGWVVEPPATTATIGVLGARKTDSKGRPMIATLSDVRSERGLHQLTLRIDIPRERRRR